MNPRSFANIREAIRTGQVDTRGELARKMQEAFFEARFKRRRGELFVKEEEEEAVRQVSSK